MTINWLKYRVRTQRYEYLAFARLKIAVLLQP